MSDHDRSGWTLLMATALFALLVTSFFLPWFTYRYSSGQRTPPGGPQDPSDRRIVRERLDLFPYHSTGSSKNASADQVNATTHRLGLLWAAPTGLGVVVALLELPLPRAFPARRVSLGVIALGVAASAAAGLWAWFRLPALLKAAGVQGPFTTRALAVGYVQTTLGWGWVLAACSVLALIAAFAFKFQAGAADPSAIEEIARAR